MNRKCGKVLAAMVAVVVLSVTVFELSAHARAGARRSSGSGGSQSYSKPASPAPQQSPARQQVAPAPSPIQQPAGGGFMRNVAGGLMGGMLGGLLFSSIAGASGGMGGMGGLGGSGVGLFEILLLAGGGFLLFRYFAKKRTYATAPASGPSGYARETIPPVTLPHQSAAPLRGELETGLDHIRSMDPAFDESRFNDSAMDGFFQIQAAWMHRDLAPAAGFLTEEMARILQADLDQLLRDKQINKLENIAVRKVEVVEAWQERGCDYITASIVANLLDYTTDEMTGAVVCGSKTESVKFQEYWTFTRPVGANPWQLSAIRQS